MNLFKLKEENTMLKRSFLSKAAALTIAASTLFSVPVMAAPSEDADIANGIQKTVTVTEDGKTVIEGMVANPYGIRDDGIAPYWLAQGPLYQYPAEGGEWEYGFWNLKVRSYYTVDRCHGSTVELDGKQSRSVDTAAGYQSIAEKWAVQSPSGDDRYYYRVCD